MEAPLGRHVDDRRHRTAATYVVRAGDTLYSVAWRYGLDYRDLAQWNGLGDPDVIFSGQRLRLTAPPRPVPVARPAPQPPSRGDDGAAAASVHARAPAPPPEATARPAPRVREAAPAPRPPPVSVDDARVDAWAWPARGPLLASFKSSGRTGIDIGGKLGQPVHATAPGRVVYSGGGLRGYGKLIIVKHNKRYLSAYAHNNKLLVKEGDSVAAGQRIAEMGHSETDRVKLHFEIRRDGKPVDPARYLAD